MTSRKSKLCKFLSCGCRRICSCNEEDTKPTSDARIKQYTYDAEQRYSPNPCSRPWMSSWFDSTDRSSAEHRNTYCTHDIETTYSKTYDDKMDFYRGGRSAYPTQSRRIKYNAVTTIPTDPILPPSHSVVGHPSLKIYRFKLPPHLLHLLEQIVAGCAEHASSLPTGWM